VGSQAYALLTTELRAEIAEELNVRALESFETTGDLVDHSAKGNFRNLGKRFGKETPKVAAAIAAADAGRIAAELSTGALATVDVDGESVTVGADEVIIAEHPREGWSVVNDQGETVALDLELDDELRLAGLAREAIRVIQEARKSSGFDISDRITLSWAATGPMAEAFTAHKQLIADEVLATEITESSAAAAFTDEELGLSFDLVVA
jgi:isoleucyl-tRNA synthetase